MPKFKHDCDNCKFLGTYEDHDLYICVPQDEEYRNILHTTVIARYGNDGSNYCSGLEFAQAQALSDLTEKQLLRKLLRVAALIAKDLGYEVGF